MKKESISVEQFLQSQAEQGFRATLEIVENQKDQIKITPFLSGQACQCSMSIKLPKASIESVTLTGETHLCCGKNLQVVEVQFKKGAGISPQSILEQLVANASHAKAPHGAAIHTELAFHPKPTNPIFPQCQAQYDRCMSNPWANECLCRNAFLVCTGHGGLQQRCLENY
jgi:hypothetical protein